MHPSLRFLRLSRLGSVACLFWLGTLVSPVHAATDRASLAGQVCQVLHGVIASRRAACCPSLGHGSDLVAVCSSTLEAALQRGQVDIDQHQLARCRRGMRRQLRGCDWLGPLQPELPAECAAIVVGKLAAGERCESTPECAEGLYCRGLRPTAPGICAPPAVAKAACELPADPLLALVAGGAGGRQHPSCAGNCVRGVCLAQAQEGGQCSASAQCAAGLNCLDGSCSARALPVLGASCSASSACADGTVCVDARCTLPKAGGAQCHLPFECRSLECQGATPTQAGHCADVCPASSARLIPPGR